MLYWIVIQSEFCWEICHKKKNIQGSQIFECRDFDQFCVFFSECFFHLSGWEQRTKNLNMLNWTKWDQLTFNMVAFEKPTVDKRKVIHTTYIHLLPIILFCSGTHQIDKAFLTCATSVSPVHSRPASPRTAS